MWVSLVLHPGAEQGSAAPAGLTQQVGPTGQWSCMPPGVGPRAPMCTPGSAGHAAPAQPFVCHCFSTGQVSEGLLQPRM